MPVPVHAEVLALRTGRIYDVGAVLHARVAASGRAWAPLPLPVRDAVRHIGSMSWAGEEPEASVAALHRSHVAYVRDRLCHLPAESSSTPVDG